MKKTLMLLVVGAFVAAGCSTASVAATVDSMSIQDAAVLSLAGQSPDDGTVDGEEFRQSLTFLVLQAALLQAASDDYGIPDLSTDAGRQAYLATASQEDLDAISSQVAQGVDQGREQAAVEDFVVSQLGMRSLVRDAIVHDPAVIEAAWNDDRDVLLAVCASHILVATEEEAIEAIDRINAGESFADVANDVSLDTQSPGGALPCPTHAYLFPEAFADAVATAPLGELSDPFETQFGFHVVQVDTRERPESFDELTTDPARWVPADLIDAQYFPWLDDAVGRATVSVRSQIGSWDAQLDTVTPPPSSP